MKEGGSRRSDVEVEEDEEGCRLIGRGVIVVGGCSSSGVGWMMVDDE